MLREQNAVLLFMQPMDVFQQVTQMTQWLRSAEKAA